MAMGFLGGCYDGFNVTKNTRMGTYPPDGAIFKKRVAIFLRDVQFAALSAFKNGPPGARTVDMR